MKHIPITAVTVLLALAACSPAPTHEHSSLDPAVVETRERIDEKVKTSARNVREAMDAADATPADQGGFHPFGPTITLDGIPPGSAADDASDADIEKWIRELGETRGDAARKAEDRLLMQGLRVAKRLHDVADEDSLRGSKAGTILEILEPRFKAAWSAECVAPALTQDGKGVIGWNHDYGITLLDAATGREIWEIPGGIFRERLPSRRWGLMSVIDYQPFTDPDSGKVVVAENGATSLQVDPESAILSEVSRPQADRDSFSSNEFGGIRGRRRLAEGIWIRWSSTLARLTLPDCPQELRLTLGDASRVVATGSDAFRLHVLLSCALNTYAIRSAKLTSVARLPQGASWMSVSRRSSRVVVGGSHWCSFVVVEGEPPAIVLRDDIQVDPMTAMAADVTGKWIATADENGMIRVFLAETLERVATLDSGMPVGRLEFSSDGSLLLASPVERDSMRSESRVKAFRLVDPERR